MEKAEEKDRTFIAPKPTGPIANWTPFTSGKSTEQCVVAVTDYKVDDLNKKLADGWELVRETCQADPGSLIAVLERRKAPKKLPSGGVLSIVSGSSDELREAFEKALLAREPSAADGIVWNWGDNTKGRWVLMFSGNDLVVPLSTDTPDKG